MREEADCYGDPWELSDGSAAQREDIDESQEMQLALLESAQRSAARAGAEWYAAEFARRDEEEQRQRASVQRWEPANAESELVDASVEDDVVGGTPTGLGIR